VDQDRVKPINGAMLKKKANSLNNKIINWEKGKKNQRCGLIFDGIDKKRRRQFTFLQREKKNLPEKGWVLATVPRGHTP